MSVKIGWEERKKMVELDLKKHGGKYTISASYDGSEYIDSTSKIRLICPSHGEFSAIARSISGGHGCMKCSREAAAAAYRKNTDAVIEQIKCADVRYTFVGFEGGAYLNKNSKAIRACNDHGVFVTGVNNILVHRHGCPSCARHGYDSNKPGYIYGLLSACGKYLKIGITNKLKQRLAQLERSTPFEFHVLSVYQDANGARCRMLERYFHRTHASAELSNFDGASEWMVANSEIIAEFTELCNGKVRSE